MYRDINEPNCWVSDDHLSRRPEDVPEEQHIQGHWDGHNNPHGGAQTGHAVSQQADKTTDCERREDVRFSICDVEPTPQDKAVKRIAMSSRMGAGRVSNIYPLGRYRSADVKPVCFAIRASMRGPISSLS